jgi:hypothetical protein
VQPLKLKGEGKSHTATKNDAKLLIRLFPILDSIYLDRLAIEFD